MTTISRRRFLEGTAATVAALSLPGTVPAAVRAMGPAAAWAAAAWATTVIDPPVGAALKLLAPMANETPGTGVFQVSIEARRARGRRQRHDGQPADLQRARSRAR